MNRDLLYSLGLALAAWPPVFGEAPDLQPVEPPPAIHASIAGPECPARLMKTDRPAETPASAGDAYKPYSSR